MNWLICVEYGMYSEHVEHCLTVKFIIVWLLDLSFQKAIQWFYSKAWRTMENVMFLHF
jgi:hypothetical protein